jgi:hypothetical protein
MLHRLTCPSLALFLVVTACGDDGRVESGGTGTGTDSLSGVTDTPTGSTAVVDPTDSAGTTEGGSNSNSNSATEPTSATTQSSDPTTQSSDPTATGSTTAGVCEEIEKCGGECCGADEVCDNGECVPDCGGPPPCGEAKQCCADGDLCHLGECVTPGPACEDQVCATKPFQSTCERGLHLRPVAEAVPAVEGQPDLSVHPAAQRVQARAAVHVGQAQEVRLRDGLAVPGRRGVHRQGVHADLEALGPGGRRHAGVVPGLVDPAGRRPRRQLRPRHHLQHLHRHDDHRPTA